MTENQEQKGMPENCCGEDRRKSCCEQMAKMMQNYCSDGETGFDCASMMGQMGFSPSKPGEDKQ